MKPQLFSALLAGGAIALILYIIARKYAIALFAAFSIACIPLTITKS